MKRASTTKAKVIAFYLPQYYPIPENDQWWGKGFTEWTNVARARPLFDGHYQPKIPGDLGFYDLRVAETRIAQAELARMHGIDGFCYYHYWFAGKRLLQLPFQEVLDSGKPDFPFCICWANETWTGIWHGLKDRILVEQTYPPGDDEAHFRCLLKAFADSRYIAVDGKPVLILYHPLGLPDPLRFTEKWREMAQAAGLKGIYLIGVNVDPKWTPQASGFDASITPRLPNPHKWKTRWISLRRPLQRLQRWYRVKKSYPAIYDYRDECVSMVQPAAPGVENFPCLIPNWDNTPRSGVNGLVLHGSTPDLFRKQVAKALEVTRGKPAEKRILFIKAWNEWAEGNYMEPDLKFGKAYLEVISEELHKDTQRNSEDVHAD